MSSAEPTGPPVITDTRPWRLIIPHRAWGTTTRALLSDRRLWGAGKLTWNTTATARELLADTVTTTPEVPVGRTRPPLADWVVLKILSAADRLSVDTADGIAAQLAPGRTQLLVVIVLDGADPGCWDGAVFRNGQREPLDEVHIVGPGMLRLSREGVADEPVEAQAELRASRTRGALGADLYRRVRQSTATIVGGGRIGTTLAFQLAGLGIGRLRIVEPDVLGLENLDAMPGLTIRDVGVAKAQALARRLRQFRPDLAISLLEKPITDQQAPDFLRQRSDVLITAVDNDTPRLAAAIIARQTLTMHLDVATSIQRGADGTWSIAGDARLFLPGPGEGCVACVGGLENLDETLYDLNAPPGSLRRRLRPAWNEERAGSLVTINAITVGAALHIWLDVLSGRTQASFWQRLAWTSGQGLVSHAGAVQGARDCRFCGGN